MNKLPQLRARMQSLGVASLHTATERLPVEQEAWLILGGHPSLRVVTLPAEEGDWSKDKPIVVYVRAEGKVEGVGFAPWW